MIIAALLALALLSEKSPSKADSIEVDAGCLLAVAAFANIKPSPNEDGGSKTAALGLMQFYIGRLSVLDPHTSWAEFVATHVKETSDEQAIKLAPTCIRRASDLRFGDHLPLPSKAR